eukprot:XP_001705290.1 Hypothetical protein GL50803_3676 [Giardia lamblia ATCC 50803]
MQYPHAPSYKLLGDVIRILLCVYKNIKIGLGLSIQIIAILKIIFACNVIGWFRYHF